MVRVCLLCLAGLATPAFADTAYVKGNFTDATGTFQSQQTSTPDGTGTIKLSDNYATTNAVSHADSASASYQVQVGAVKLKSAASINGVAADYQDDPNAYYATQLGAAAGWHDDLTITQAGGGFGIATVQLIVAGAIGTTGVDGYGELDLALSAVSYDEFANGSFYLSGFKYTSSGLESASFGASGQPPATSPFRTYTYDIHFMSGDAIPLDVNASCSSLASLHVEGGAASSSCALDHSIYWGGIVSVKNAQGQATSYSTSSLSGFNYTLASALAPGAVPEPASWAMIVGGFGLIGGTLRRKRQSALIA
jgi:hypothetical protein